MLITSQFKVDLFQLKHTNDPASLLEAHKRQAAIELGIEMAKQFPFVKNEELSFKGELPAMSMNRLHEYNYLYESRFVLISKSDFDRIYALASNVYDPLLRSGILNLLTSSK